MQSFESSASQDRRPNVERPNDVTDGQYLYHERYQSATGLSRQESPGELTTHFADKLVGEASGESAPSAKGGGKNGTTDRLAADLTAFNSVAEQLRNTFKPASDFRSKCVQAFELANELFVNAPTWVCFYRELMGGRGFITALFPDNEEFGSFLRTEEYHQIQMMLTALRSRDIPENDPNDPQRMITVRLPKSLHEAMCEEANRLNISVNRLCISRMLQLLDPKMIPETQSKPRGRKPRLRSRT